MINKLYTICLLVRAFDASMAFYKDNLGLELNSQDTGFADFKLEGTSLAIFEKKTAEAMFPGKYMNSGGSAVLAIQVEDFDKAVNDLKAKNINIFEGPKTTAWGQTVLYFLDPDKNIWEVSKK